MNRLPERFENETVSKQEELLAVHEKDTDASRALTEGRLLLSNPEDLPLRDIANVVEQTVLVVAPHPDDETLGCGGAIALLCNEGHNLKILVISDGTLSHPNSKKYPAPVLQSLREKETLAALAILGVDQEAVTFLRLKDGSIPMLISSNFQRAKELCYTYLAKTIPATIFIPWRSDPHPDHRATWQLIRSALLDLKIGSEYCPKCIEYPIWDWDTQQQKEAPSLSKFSGWRLDIEAVLQQKRQAIAAYRSQLGQIIDDDPNGFCLTSEILSNFTRSWEVYFEEIL
jgi:LmbE family N-acetylglucosaminyl deacetylase